MICFKNYLVLRNSWIPKCNTHMLCMVQDLYLSSKMLVGQTWVLAKIIDDTLLLVVKQHVLIPTWRHWFLLNVLTFTFTWCITLKFDVASIENLNETLICDNFDLELQEFKWWIMVQVVGILMPFLAFSMIYNHFQAHNMLMIMLDFCYKNMKCIQGFVIIQLMLNLLQNMMLKFCVLICYKCIIT